jgi:hypothetical protein
MIFWLSFFKIFSNDSSPADFFQVVLFFLKKVITGIKYSATSTIAVAHHHCPLPLPVAVAYRCCPLAIARRP